MFQSLGVKELCVVDFYADRSKLTPAMIDWMNRNLNSKVLSAENCERHIWMGSVEQFASLPDISGYDGAKTHCGAEAYSFMLQYMTGFANPFGLDRPANDRFYVSWGKMNNRSVEGSAALGQIVAKLQADSEFIKANIADHVRPVRPWLIAREKSGQTKGSKILVLGNLTNDGKKITDVAQRILTTANGEPRMGPSQLRYLFPEDIEDVAGRDIQKLQSQSKLRIPNIAAIGIDDLAKEIEAADVVYVTFPPGQNPGFDQYLADIWRGRVNTRNVLIHTDVRDGVQLDSEAFAGLSGHLSASKLQRFHELRAEEYESLKTLAAETADSLAAGRLRNIDDGPCREQRSSVRSTIGTLQHVFN